MSSIEKHLRAIIGVRSPEVGHAHLAEVLNYVRSTFQEAKLDVELHDFTALGKTYQNVIGRKVGSSPKKIIIGAHFDSKPTTPGADDNASGVAVMLEVASRLRDVKLKHTLEFVGFNLEEYKTLGSLAYAKDLKKSKADVLGMISLEMVGFANDIKGSQKLLPGLKYLYPNTGNFIAFVSNLKSMPFLSHFQKGFKQVIGLPAHSLIVPFSGWLVPAVRHSDHAPFWDAGFPALMVTDTSYFRNPNYHLPSDTLESLNLPFMEKVAAGVEATLRLSF